MTKLATWAVSTTWGTTATCETWSNATNAQRNRKSGCGAPRNGVAICQHQATHGINH